MQTTSAHTFDGVHGLFRHKRPDKAEYVKVGYHEGLVGLTKCSHCKYSFVIFYKWNTTKTTQWRYYGDTGAYKADGCISKRLKTRPDTVEQAVLGAMKERIENLVIAKTRRAKPDTETESIKAEVIRLDDEIRELMDKLAKADDVLFAYIQDRVKALHAKKSDLDEKLRTKARKHKEIDTAPLLDPMSRWDSLSNDEKHTLAVTMIDVVYISDEDGIDIRFSI